jgi:hypothetical protein
MWQENNPGQEPTQEPKPEPQRFEIPIFMAQLNTKITNLENQVEQLTKLATSNFDLYANLQKNIREFLENNREDDKIEFDIDEANSFLAENSIEPLKRLYLVQFRIEGEIEVEAENEDEALGMANELQVSHWSADVKTYECEGIEVDTAF